MISAGDKIAKAIGARFIRAKTGTLGIQVGFSFFEEVPGAPAVGRPEKLYWTGWLTETALKNTMKTLTEVLDYNGDDEVENVAESDRRYGMLKNQDAINRNKEVKLVVEMERNPDNGKEYPKIKWVNNIGGGQFAGCSPEVVRNHLGAIGFRAAYLAVKQGLPPPVASPVQGSLMDEPQLTEQDLPF